MTVPDNAKASASSPASDPLTLPGEAVPVKPVEQPVEPAAQPVERTAADTAPLFDRAEFAAGDQTGEATPAQRFEAQPDPLTPGALALEWYDDKGRDTRGQEKRSEAFRRARERLDAMNLATATDIEAQAAYMEVVRTHPLFGYMDSDGSKTFGPEAVFGKDNARRMKGVLDGSDPEALYDAEYREWKGLSPEAQADLAQSKRSFVATAAESLTAPAAGAQSVIGGPALPLPVAAPVDREAVRKEYEAELLKKQRGAWYAAVMSDMSDMGKDWVRASLDAGAPDGRALWLVPEADRGFALSAYRIAKGETDVNALMAGTLDAADSVKGMTAGAGGMLRYVYNVTGGRSSSGSPRRASMDAEETMRAQLADAAVPVFKKYGFAGEAAKGLIGSLPLMMSYMNPVTGTLATLGMAEDARRAMLTEGIDPETSAAVGFGVGVLNSYIDKIQWEQMTGAGMSELELRTHGLAAMVRTLKEFDLVRTGEHAGKMLKHGGKVTFQELGENVLQELNTELGTQYGKGELDVKQLADTFEDAVLDSIPTVTAFGMVAGSGVGASVGARVRKMNYGEDVHIGDIAEIARRRLAALHAVNQADGADGTAEERAGRTDALVRDLRTAWRAAPGGRAAVRVLEDAGLDKGQVALLDEMFQQEAVVAGDSPAFRSMYQSEDLNADISPASLRESGPAFVSAEKVSDTETLAVMRIAPGREATVLFRKGDTSRESDPERFDAQTADRFGIDEWNKATESGKNDMRNAYTARAFFVTVGDATLGYDGIITLAAPDGQGGGARMGDLYHETFHAATLLARKAGVLTDGHAATLRKLFGDPRSDGETFNEEAAAVGYAQWVAGKAEDSSGAWSAVRDFFRKLYEAVFKKPATAAGGAWTVDSVFDAVNRGDLSGMPSMSGVQMDAAAVQQTPVSVQEPVAEVGGSVQQTPVSVKSPAPADVGKWSAVTPQGNVRVGGTWEVVPLADLVTSDSLEYDQTLQPRDRSSVGSRQQVQDILAKFDAGRLFDSAETDGGSPIIAGGKQVVSGNGRTMALRKLAQSGRWGEYDAAMREQAAAVGVSVPSGMVNPMLVRRISRIPAGSSMQAVAELSNRSKILTRSPAELAEADAKAIRLAGLASIYSPGSDGSVTAASNRSFLSAFVRAVGDPGLFDSNANPTDALESRVRRAMLALVVGEGDQSREVIRTLVENAGELGMRREVDGVMRAAGNLVALADAKPAYDILPDVSQTLRDYMQFKRDKAASMAEWLGQGDLLASPRSPEVVALLKAFDARRTSGGVDALLRRYAELARGIDLDTPDMFGAAAASKSELVAKAEADTLGAGEEVRFSLVVSDKDADSRKAVTFAQARAAAEEFKGKPLRNWTLNITAVLSRNNLDKMLSESAAVKSASHEAHAWAVANLDRLFETASLDVPHGDRENSTAIKTMHRVWTVAAIGGKRYPVKMTVKEMARESEGSKLYSVEVVEIETPAGIWVASTSGVSRPTSTPQAGVTEERVAKWWESVNGGAGARFSGRLNGKPEDVAAQIIGMKLLRGENVSIESVEKMLSGMGSKAPADDVLRWAQAGMLGVRGKIEYLAHSDREMMEVIRKGAMQQRFDDIVNKVTTLAFEEGSEEAKAAVRMEEAKRKAVAREIDNAEGFAAATLELEYGVDFAESLLASAPVKPAASGKAGDPSETADTSAVSPDLSASDLRPPSSDLSPVPVSAEALAALERIRKRAQVRAEADKAARAEAALRREKTAEQYAVDVEADAALAAGSGSGDAASQQAALRATKRDAFAIDDPAHFRAMLEEMVVDRLSKREGFNPDRPFASPAALREFALTAKHVLYELATKLNHSATREFTRLDLEKLTDFERLASLEGSIERIFTRIHGQMITETREKLISDLERDIRVKAGARGAFQRGGDESRRAVEGRVEEWSRIVLGYLRMTDAEIEAETGRLDGILNGRKAAAADADGYDLSFDRDFQQAIDRKAALTAYGGLILRMPGEISDKAAEIMEQIEGGRERLEARRDEREERTQRAANQLASAMENPEGVAMPEPGRWGMLADSLLGMFDLRLRDLIRFSRGDVRDRAVNVIGNVGYLISRASEVRSVYTIRQREALRDGLKAAYGSERAALKRLDSKLADGVWQQLSNQGVHMTVGQALQLYASVMQSDYRDNSATHGRDKQLPLLKAQFMEQDLALLAWLRQFYRDNRVALDEAYLPVTGLSIQSPGETYMPVQPLRVRSGLVAKVKAWSPLPASLTPRVRHRLDFDERADILGVWDSRLADSSSAIAYAETGLELAAIFGRDHLQERLVRHHGTAALTRMLSHLTDTLRGGKSQDLTEGGMAVADTFRAWVSRFALAGNVGSALKQLAAFPAFALHPDVGLGDVITYMVNIDRAAVRDLTQSDGFKARYGGGVSEEIANALRGERHGWLARVYNMGFEVPQFGDMVTALWIGQGIYRSRLATLTDGGDAETAKRRALAETWAIVESTQQSARTENMNAIQRNGGGLGRLLYQFVSSPAQQLSYEVQAIREALALKGAEGSKGRLLRVLFINHVVLTGTMLLATSAWRSLLGYPDDEKESTFWETTVSTMLAGPSSGLFLAGAAGEGGLQAFISGKRDWRSQGLPVENIYQIFETVGVTAHDVLIECDAERVRADLIRLVKSTSAPGRAITQAIQNRTD